MISSAILFFVVRTTDHFVILRHTGKTTQTAVTPPETLVSSECTPGRPRNWITQVSVAGPGTFLKVKDVDIIFSF
jgi:hypothetical protein